MQLPQNLQRVPPGPKDENSIASQVGPQLPLNTPTDTTANTISDQNSAAQASAAHAEFQEGSEGAAGSKPKSASAKTGRAEFEDGNLDRQNGNV